MSRGNLVVTAVAIGMLVGALGIGAASTGALAAGSPGQATQATAVAQATATPAPGWGCPFLTGDGTFDLDAMHEWMDQFHGQRTFEQMWSWMTGGAAGDGSSAPPAPGPGAGWHGGMMGGRFGGPAQ